MKINFTTIIPNMVFVATGCGIFAQPECSALTLTFGSTSGTAIQFSEGKFSFTPATTNQLFIVGPNTPLDYATISGSFSLGAIETQPEGVESAPVTGSGTLTIHDGAGFDLTATLNCVSAETWPLSHASGGVLNGDGDLNVSDIVYHGQQTDLLALADAGEASAILSFTFQPAPKTLTQLSHGTFQTPIYGELSVDTDSGPAASAPTPTLLLSVNNGQVALSWPTNATNFHLEQATSPGSAADWSVVTNAPAISGDNYVVSLAPSTNHCFYRLASP